MCNFTSTQILSYSENKKQKISTWIHSPLPSSSLHLPQAEPPWPQVRQVHHAQYVPFHNLLVQISMPLTISFSDSPTLPGVTLLENQSLVALVGYASADDAFYQNWDE